MASFLKPIWKDFRVATELAASQERVRFRVWGSGVAGFLSLVLVSFGLLELLCLFAGSHSRKYKGPFETSTQSVGSDKEV